MLKAILLGALIILAAGIVAVLVNALAFTASIRSDIARAVAASRGTGLVVTAERVAGLPPPVQRYLAWSGVIGGPIPAVVRLTQSGHIRSNPGDAWMELEAEETYTTDPPAFVWRAFFPRRSLPIVFGRDQYLDGKGSIVMRALGAFPVADERGDALVAAGLMRYLNEMLWFPAAFAGDNVAWRAIDENSAEVTLSDRGMTATATMAFDPAGRPLTFRAARYNTATLRKETWETPLTAYGSFAGAQLPIAGSALWKLPAGDFTYIELTITGVAYDPPLP